MSKDQRTTAHASASDIMTSTKSLTSAAVGQIGLREAEAEFGDVKLHYVEAGEGPLIVLLHGFPEFWFGWRKQIAPLVAEGFRVSHPICAATTCHRAPRASMTTPSSSCRRHPRPIRHLGAEPAQLVGHDWGGSIAWTTAMHHPEVRTGLRS